MFKKIIQNHIEVAQSLFKISIDIEEIADICLKTITNNKKILLCGNGGSASDSTHLTAEFIGRFERNRKALPAIDLTSNNSSITAIGNDYGFDKIFSRQIEGIGNQGDTLIAFSTSGRSKNVIEAIKAAKKKKLNTIFLTGNNMEISSILECDKVINVESNNTARIQEMHIFIGHLICQYVEKKI
jgi:D-sedoheptulose 7-phosphate isomerase